MTPAIMPSPMSEEWLRENHGYCGGCGERMDMITTIWGYDRKTGQPCKVRHWACSRMKSTSAIHSTPECDRVYVA